MQITLCDFCGRDIAPGLCGSLELRTLSADRHTYSVDATIALCKTCVTMRKPEKPVEFQARLDSEIKRSDDMTKAIKRR